MFVPKFGASKSLETTHAYAVPYTNALYNRKIFFRGAREKHQQHDKKGAIIDSEGAKEMEQLLSKSNPQSFQTVHIASSRVTVLVWRHFISLR